jgi:hypothetical protein
VERFRKFLEYHWNISFFQFFSSFLSAYYGSF